MTQKQTSRISQAQAVAFMDPDPNYKLCRKGYEKNRDFDQYMSSIHDINTFLYLGSDTRYGQLQWNTNRNLPHIQ